MGGRRGEDTVVSEVKNMEEGCQDDSEIKSIGCSFYEPRFDSQEPCGSLQLSLTPVPGDSFCWLLWALHDTVHTNKCKQITHIPFKT